MTRILVGTDFSTRSDRALRRAAILARSWNAELVIAHVLDDDRPKHLIEVERTEAETLLSELAETIRKADGLSCRAHLALGNPFQGIAKIARVFAVDAVVMGPHRRQALRDAFVGTTLERTIRHADRPVIMANGVPAADYTRVLIASDFSECSARAIEAVRCLGQLRRTEVLVLHVFDPPGRGLMYRAAVKQDDLTGYLLEEERTARGELEGFLDRLAFAPDQRLLLVAEAPTGQMIVNCAHQRGCDLIVVGTRGRGGIQKLLLGSVAEEVLRVADIDILAVPPAAEE